MILVLIFILSFISCLILFLNTSILFHWYDFYIVILVFIGFFIAYFIIHFLFFSLITFTHNKKKGPKPSKFLDEYVKRMSEMVLQLFKVRINVRGLDLIDFDKNYMLVQNHLSMLDPLITLWALRYFNFSFLYKKNLTKVPVLGHVLSKQAHIEIDRENNRKGLEGIVKGIHLLEDGKRCVGVYPEGTRSKDGFIAQFHAGTFKMAQKSKKPIIVSVLINSNYIKKRALFASTHVYLDIVKVLEYDEYKDMTSEELSSYIHNLMSERIDELEELEYKKK